MMQWTCWRRATRSRDPSWVAFLALALFGTAIGCSTGDPDLRPNIILISMDTIRADHLSCYGYTRDTTPELDDFAKTATRYANAYSPGPWTYTSHIEMLTGQIPQEIGIYIGSLKIPESILIVSERLSNSGYQSAAFVDSRKSGYVGGKRGFGRGFESYRYSPFRDDMPFDFDAKVTFATGADWIAQKSKRGRPFFLFLHTKTAHKIKEEWAHEDYRNPPYDVPSDRFRFITPKQAAYTWQDPELGMGGELLSALNASYPMTGNVHEEFPRDQLDALMGLYDGSLHRIDEGFGEFVAFLKENELYRDTLIVVTADHGEEFLEHGQFNHRQLYQEATRIPLIIKFPADASGRVVDRNVRLADIVPTLLRAAEIEIPPEVGGVVLDGSESAIDPNRPIFTANHKPNLIRRQHLGLRRGDWSLVLRSHGKTGERSSELFNRASDPNELDPIEDQPERKEAMRAELQAWHESWPPIGGKTLVLDEETRQHLRDLGYAE